jgi:hypothetical protein
MSSLSKTHLESMSIDEILRILEARTIYWRESGLAGGSVSRSEAASMGSEAFRIAELICQASGHPMPSTWAGRLSGY